jgi:alkanesulfonate monooxygenase SsuD/methylene tetrahydromethanopterin reductase-like flavin-dependent oxidoreductase (luciferase family)
MMGRMMAEYWLPLLGQVGFLPFFKHDPDVPDEAVTPAYCAEHNWLVGSPDTVAAKLRRAYDDVGGFGTLLLFGFDYLEDPEAWHTSMRLLAEEVMPQVADLTPREGAVLAHV